MIDKNVGLTCRPRILHVFNLKKSDACKCAVNLLSDMFSSSVKVFTASTLGFCTADFLARRLAWAPSFRREKVFRTAWTLELCV